MKSAAFAEHCVTRYDDARLHLDRTNAVWVEWPTPAVEGGLRGDYFLPEDAAQLLLLQCEDFQRPAFPSARFLRDWLHRADESTHRKWRSTWKKWTAWWLLERQNESSPVSSLESSSSQNDCGAAPLDSRAE